MANQRDIVEIMFDTDDFNGNHPAVVISNKLVEDVEGYFVCLMMTSTDWDDEFSFVISNDMLITPSNRGHIEARCHLLHFVNKDDIIPNSHRNKMKIEPFKQLIKQITETTFFVGDLN